MFAKLVLGGTRGNQCRHEENMQTPQKDRRWTPEGLRIVLVGKTGCGKSSTGNTILGRPEFTAKASGKSVTQICNKAASSVDGRRVAVVDTPGLFDTSLSNEDITRETAKSISLLAPGPHAFLLLVQISRFTEEEQRAVEYIKGLFGKGAEKYIIILFTRGDDLEHNKMLIEDYIHDSVPALKKLVTDCGNRIHVFNNRNEERTQVKELLQKIDHMVEENGGSFYTSEMLQEAEEAIQKEMERILKEKEQEIRREEEKIKRKCQLELERFLQMKKQRKEEEKREIEEQMKKEQEQRKREQREWEIEHIERERERERAIVVKRLSVKGRVLQIEKQQQEKLREMDEKKINEQGLPKSKQGEIWMARESVQMEKQREIQENLERQQREREQRREPREQWREIQEKIQRDMTKRQQREKEQREQREREQREKEQREKEYLEDMERRRAEEVELLRVSYEQEARKEAENKNSFLKKIWSTIKSTVSTVVDGFQVHTFFHQ